MNFEWTQAEQDAIAAIKPICATLGEATESDTILSQLADATAKTPSSWRQTDNPLLPGMASIGAGLELAKQSLPLWLVWQSQTLAAELARECGLAVDGAPAFIATLQESATVIDNADGSLKITGASEALFLAPQMTTGLLVLPGPTHRVAAITLASTQVAPVENDPFASAQDVNLGTLTFKETPIAATALADLKPYPAYRQGADLAICTASVALMHSLFAELKAHAETATQNGKSKMGNQHVRYTLAELLTRCQAAEFLLYRATYMLGEDVFEAAQLIDAAKAFVATELMAVAAEALQIAGAGDFASGGQFARAMAKAAYLNVCGSDSDNAKSAIADALIRRYEV